MERPTFLRLGGYEVSDTMLRGPRKSYRLENIEFVSVTRPLLLAVGMPAAGVVGFTVGFWRYLELPEIMMMLGGSAGAIGMATCIGTLRIHSLALHDHEVAVNFGLVWHLRAVRHAVEQALIWREHRDPRS